MADHADQPRSALTEWPLWIWWRVMTTLAPLYRLAVGWLYRDEDDDSPLTRRLAVATAVLAVVAFALAVLVVALLV